MKASLPASLPKTGVGRYLTTTPSLLKGRKPFHHNSHPTIPLLSSLNSQTTLIEQPNTRPSSSSSTTSFNRPANMKALIYKDKNTVTLTDRPLPTLQSPTDAIIKLSHTAICGTDLHIIKGDVATATPGRVLGHEGVGVIHELGASAESEGRLSKGDTVLISCITACGACPFCRKEMSSHCVSGGWILGNTIDGTQAEYVRIPHAASSLYKLPPGKVSLRDAVMLSDALPTGLECGTMNGKVAPGSTVVIIGAGAVGMSVMLTSMLYSPALLVVVDLDETRLAMARELGAHETVNSGGDKGQVVERLMKMTDGLGFDAVVEAVGIPGTFELCQELVAAGGVVANVGVHGTKVDLHLERLWDRNISITTRLVDATTTPMLLKLFQAGRLDMSKLTTHRFPFSECEKAYEVFGAAAQHKALKVVIDI